MGWGASGDRRQSTLVGRQFYSVAQPSTFRSLPTTSFLWVPSVTYK